MEHELGPSDDPPGESNKEKVGYANPPKHTRWRPGFCPNPSGRPKKAKGRKAIVERIANERCEVKIGGKVLQLTRAEIVLIAVRNATANGNPTARKLYDQLLRETPDEADSIPKATLIVGEKLTQEEWEAEYAHLAGTGLPPPPKPIGMAQVMHLLKSIPARPK